MIKSAFDGISDVKSLAKPCLKVTFEWLFNWVLASFIILIEGSIPITLLNFKDKSFVNVPGPQPKSIAKLLLVLLLSLL